VSGCIIKKKTDHYNDRRIYEAAHSFSRDSAGDTDSVGDVRVWEDYRPGNARSPVVSIDRGLGE
jgi:hypothetical protein